jgi:hypothetical protein
MNFRLCQVRQIDAQGALFDTVILSHNDRIGLALRAGRGSR